MLRQEWIDRARDVVRRLGATKPTDIGTANVDTIVEALNAYERDMKAHEAESKIDEVCANLDKMIEGGISMEKALHSALARLRRVREAVEKMPLADSREARAALDGADQT